MDPVLEVMLYLKNGWRLTGDLASANITFGTRFYDSDITFPQIIISPLAGSPSPPIDMGSSEALYSDFQSLGIDIYVRPKGDSETSLGWAKNAIHKIRKEVENLLRSGSVLIQDDSNVNLPSDKAYIGQCHIGKFRIGVIDISGVMKFLQIGGWNRRDDLSVRPPLFHLSGNMIVINYVKGS